MKLFIVKHPTDSFKQGSSKHLVSEFAHRYGWGPLTYGDKGQAQLLNAFISVAHSHNLLTLAYANEALGVDCELRRPLSRILVKRFNLNVDDPIQDWCTREAYYKMTQSTDYIFQPIPNFIPRKVIEYDNACIVLVSEKFISNVEVIEINPLTLNLDIL